MYLSLFVTGLRLKYTSLRIVYVPPRHVPLFVRLSSRYDGRLREMLTPGQRAHPEVQK